MNICIYCYRTKISGKSYGEYLKQAFFGPLGMKNTGVHYKGIALTREATGYGYQDGEAELAPDWAMSILETYVGEYDLNGKAVNITREDSQLYLQVTGQPKFEIYPRSATAFFMKAVNAEVSFVENENKKIDQLILNQGGRDL